MLLAITTRPPECSCFAATYLVSASCVPLGYQTVTGFCWWLSVSLSGVRGASYCELGQSRRFRLPLDDVGEAVVSGDAKGAGSDLRVEQSSLLAWHPPPCSARPDGIQFLLEISKLNLLWECYVTLMKPCRERVNKLMGWCGDS